MKRAFSYIALSIGWFIAFSFASVSAADVVVNGVNLGNCSTYSDGCNTCSVGKDGQAACTMRYCIQAGTPKCLDEDTSLEDLENSGSTAIAPNFQLKTFGSCSQMEDVLSDFIEQYYRKNPGGGYYRGGPVIMEDAVWVDSPMMGDSSKSAVSSPTPSATTGNGSSEGGAKDFSQTNVQIAGVDESETVKTDGKFAYYYNSKDHRVYVTDVRDPKNVKIVRKIRIPESYGNPELYVGSGKLVVFSSKYSTIPYSYRYWFDRSQKTVVVVYDVADPVNPKIERYFQIDGSVSKTRRVGRYLYLLSSSPLSFPYDRYFIGNPEAKYPVDQKLDSAKIDREFSVSKVMPKKLELSHTSLKDANFRQKGVLLPYRIESGAASTCGETEYVLPDAATLEKYSFSPTFTTLSIIDLENVNERVRTKVFFGDTSEIMMTPTSLYLTSQMYSDSGWKCPAYARCFQPFWNAGYESLVHKISINGLTAKYAATAVVSGSPLNQYSMDEGADGTFRIVTSESGDKTSTRVSVLDKNLSPLGTVANIAPGETFRSSRFIGNKLYLVTFEQIDPLFVIDLADAKNPKIEGELKIPGYSLYLHPYAPGKLIGLGYDTVTNQWGGTQNAGIKVDLYDVSDVKNPKRLSSLTLGGIGSSSDALWNPKLFTWYAAKNQLFLPVTLMEPSKLANEPYRYSGAFQGTVAFSIDPVSGIKETGRVTHIEAKDLSAERKKDCAQYATVETAPRCEKIIGGGEYCPPVSTYVPPYCYESSTDGEYFANQIWKYSDSFVTRNLYLDNALYTFSNVKMVGSDLTNAFSTLSVTEWK